MPDHAAPGISPSAPESNPATAEARDEQLRLFSRVVEQSSVSVLITDAQGGIIYVNPRFCQLTGYAREEVYGRKPSLLQSGNTPVWAYQDLWNSITAGREWRGEFQNRKKNGDLYWESALITPLKNPEGVITHYIGLLEDLSERKKTEKLFKHMAYHDALTDLPNQTLFNDLLLRALARAKQNQQMVAVMILDLDRFKVINETLGHRLGDQVIQLVGERLSGRLRKEDTIARMSGDEFLLLLPGLTHFREAIVQAQSIMDAFQEPFVCDGRELHINASLGISLYPEDANDSQTLLKNADAALYDAKDAGRSNYKFYKVKIQALASERLALENALRRGLEREEFLVYYQPQVNVQTGQIIGAEALVRWQHPELGILGPIEFIPLAEETGLIVPLGKWVLATACAQNRAWQLAGLPAMRMAVNLSARQFQEPELVETILKILAEAELQPTFLELEITESILMKDINITNMILKWLNKKGIRIAIDDFGTGYSSLMYLKRFPIDTLKIDRSFIRDSLVNSDNAALVTAIASLAKNLNLNVIAEGVETEGQLSFISGLHCDEMQGFLFSPPVPAEIMTELLKTGHRLPGNP